MAKFITIGERLSTTAPAVNKAFTERDEEPILKRAKQQLDAGATYLDVNIGPAESDGEDLMKWAVQLLQGEFDNVPLALDTSNKKAIEAGISVYSRAKGKPIVNSADAAGRIEYLDLAAANDAICIALCNGEGIAKDNDERMAFCQTLLERGLEHGMEAEDIWFDPLFLVVKGMQDKQMQEAVSNTLILLQLMMQSLSLFATLKVLQKIMTNVWDTARHFWKEVWSMVWKQKICGLTHYSWL